MSTAEWLLRRDRWLTAGALAVVAVLAWAYTLAGAGLGMSAMDMTRAGMTPTSVPAAVMGNVTWTIPHAAIMLAMWWVMMVAMMLPSVAPVVLLAAAINHRSNMQQAPFGATSAFVSGYLLAWLFFCVCAVAVQWVLQKTGQLSATMHVTSAYVSAALLIAAGAWQFTPAKRACLKHCRGPVELLVRWRRPGTWGALVMGARHGGYCLGCCWFLMALLFVGGAMNLYWIVGLSLYVLLEKFGPRGGWVEWTTGTALVLGGAIVLLH